jgi:anthranilate 1,2-dioxygenase ferredoxin subunit
MTQGAVQAMRDSDSSGGQDPSGPKTWQRVGSSDDFIESEPWPVVLSCGQRVAIVRFEGKVFGVADQCTHGDARLSEGWAEDGWIECPLHQGRFSLIDGKPLCEPVTEAVRCFAVREQDGGVWVEGQP